MIDCPTHAFGGCSCYSGAPRAFCPGRQVLPPPLSPWPSRLATTALIAASLGLVAVSGYVGLSRAERAFEIAERV